MGRRSPSGFRVLLGARRPGLEAANGRRPGPRGPDRRFVQVDQCEAVERVDQNGATVKDAPLESAWAARAPLLAPWVPSVTMLTW